MSEDTKTKVENCKECGSHNTFSDDKAGTTCQSCFELPTPNDEE